jgi:hypothetical protein
LRHFWQRHHLHAAATFLLIVWLVLGACGASIYNQPKPKNYILNVIDAGTIDLHAPLCWHGVLRDEPASLPWGISYEIELSSVDYQEQSIPIQGGLHASYSPRAEVLSLPDVHAGDEVAIVTQARLPQLFRDEGAFDRRTYLRAGRGTYCITSFARTPGTNSTGQSFPAYCPRALPAPPS